MKINKKNQVFSKIFFKTPTHPIKKLYQIIAIDELNIFMGVIFINFRRKKKLFQFYVKFLFVFSIFCWEINQLI